MSDEICVGCEALLAQLATERERAHGLANQVQCLRAELAEWTRLATNAYSQGYLDRSVWPREPAA